MSSRGFCSHWVARAVVLSTGNSIIRQCSDFPHCAARRLAIKEMVPNDSNANTSRGRVAGCGIAPLPVTPTLRRGSLSQIVPTQVTRPGKHGTPGDGFRSSLGLLTRRGK